jgi:probable rRNA maturation factor
LGTRYDVSVVLCGTARSQRLNRAHRKKNYPTNVLSFPLSRTSGEIYLNMPLCRREARSFGTTPKEHAVFLLIHGCLHLKGYDHGKKMEAREKKFLRQFSPALR